MKNSANLKNDVYFKRYYAPIMSAAASLLEMTKKCVMRTKRRRVVEKTLVPGCKTLATASEAKGSCNLVNTSGKRQKIQKF